MDRLTAQDLSTLWPDDIGWPQDIGALAVLDGSKLIDADGQLRIQQVRDAIGSRLHLVPRFRQALHIPRRGLGWPLWVDAASFDIAEHVRVCWIPTPGDETQLLLTTERLRRRRLDRSRPLWEMWLLPGLAGGRVGLYMKVHHAIADGVAGVSTLGAFLDAAPEPVAHPAPAWTPAPLPTSRELFSDNLQRRADAFAHAMQCLLSPVATARRARRAWPAVRETLLASRAPWTSLNQPISAGRKLAVVRARLDLTKRVAHAHGGTVNDVLMAAIAGGLGELLWSRGEPVEDLVLRGYVPVSLRRDEPGPSRGNLDGVMVIPLPLGVADPVQRLRLITGETVERKKLTRPPAGTLLRNGLVQRAFLHVMARQRWANTYVANVPGPPVQLYLAGAPLLEVFPLVPLIGNVTLGVGALSYAGQFNLTVVADEAACPDVEIFAAGVAAELRSLTASLPRSTAQATAG
ncbi:MAG TPA: wax ester/triacylglycerol synthase family O-acyltransferase [Actinomycetes bacterium]|jgi:WS/DGAT/MGAT family acyltransferase|nr:wax ester/triacylglycerol synthase family O-acyltransferase [Actinomycetes bacterium]